MLISWLARNLESRSKRTLHMRRNTRDLLPRFRGRRVGKQMPMSERSKRGGGQRKDRAGCDLAVYISAGGHSSLNHDTVDHEASRCSYGRNFPHHEIRKGTSYLPLAIQRHMGPHIMCQWTSKQIIYIILVEASSLSDMLMAQGYSLLRLCQSTCLLRLPSESYISWPILYPKHTISSIIIILALGYEYST